MFVQTGVLRRLFVKTQRLKKYYKITNLPVEVSRCKRRHVSEERWASRLSTSASGHEMKNEEWRMEDEEQTTTEREKEGGETSECSHKSIL